MAKLSIFKASYADGAIVACLDDDIIFGNIRKNYEVNALLCMYNKYPMYLGILCNCRVGSSYFALNFM